MSGFSSRLRAGTMLSRGLFNRSASAGPRRLLVIGGVGVLGLATVAIIATSGHKADTPSLTARMHSINSLPGGLESTPEQDKLALQTNQEQAAKAAATGQSYTPPINASQEINPPAPSPPLRRTTGEDCGEPPGGVPLRQCGSAPDVGYPDGPLCASAHGPPGRGHPGRSQSGAHVLRRDQSDASRLGWPIPSDHRCSRGEVRRGTGQRGSRHRAYAPPRIRLPIAEQLRRVRPRSSCRLAEESSRTPFWR